MATYSVIASEDTVQALSPTVAVDAIATTIQVSGSNIVATLVLPQTWFDSGEAPLRLKNFADYIDAIWTDGKVSAGVGGQTIDTNGQLQYVIDWTVSYQPTGSPFPPLTTQVEVLTADIGGTGLGTGNVGPTYAEGLIDAAYSQLEQLSASGTPPGGQGTTTSGA